MRNFEERKAEIFRRSENRIKKRKRNRDRFLAMCIPLCLIITVMSVTILPSFLPAYNKNMAKDEMPEAVGELRGDSAEFISVSLEGIGTTPQTNIFVDDVNEVEQIYYAVRSSFVDSVGNNKESSKEKEDGGTLTEENKAYSQSGTTTFSSGYKLTFTAGNGTQSIYALDGYILTDCTTDKSVILTDTQRSQILHRLGMVIAREEEHK